MLHTTHSSTSNRGSATASHFAFASANSQQLALLDSTRPAPVWTASAREPISLAETAALQASTQQPVISKAGTGSVGGGMDSAMLALGFVGAWLVVVGVALLVRRWRNLRSEALFRI